MTYRNSFSFLACFLILLLFDTRAYTQKSSSFESIVNNLNQALIDKNQNQLSQLLHEDLSYGHSNGWVETKDELINNNVSHYLIYERIQMDSLTLNYSGKFAIIRYQAIHDVILKEKKISLLLHVCQVWIKSKGRWQLLARQSTKLS